MKKYPEHHIALVWRKLDKVAGGVERFSINLANEMVRRGHKISFFTWDDHNAEPFFALDKRVTWIKLNLGNPAYKATWRTRIKRFLKFRRNLKKASPDVILVFESGIFLVVRIFLFALHYRIVLAERNSPSKHSYLRKRSKLFSIFGHYIASEIVFQFIRYKEFLPKFLHHKVIGLPNPVPILKTSNRISQNSKRERKSILFIGRLAYQKNVIALVQAFLELAAYYPCWDLIIGGGGPEKATLCKVSEESQLSHRVIFLGTVENTYSLYLNSDIFCVPSFYEGFPNTLAEALASGLPSIGFRNCCGVSDLIQHGANGLLAEGPMTGENLSSSLRKLMDDPQLRDKMSDFAQSSMLRFNPAEVYSLWEKFLLKGHCK